MASVYVSIGTNINRYHHVTVALDHLQSFFGPIVVSNVYESEAVGFDGDNFLNLVAQFETQLPVGELSRWLKRLEDENGRCRDTEKFSARTLDIDILTYDDLQGEIDSIQLPRDEVTKNAFVLLPLSEIAPDVQHPAYDKTYAEMWAEYDQSKQKLWSVNFEWQGKVISKA
jgi:2-amino-4-hydroxy-6-hydroxymethyldihydropteridine diphosphokinase